MRKYAPLTGKGFINGATIVIRNDTSNINDSPHFDGGMKPMWDEQESRT
ncbi:hypothetical protein [Streptomyces jumonjinensis]|nr:hypothetical protein [Streptomyces jumonjinensis]